MSYAVFIRDKEEECKAESGKVSLLCFEGRLRLVTL